MTNELLSVTRTIFDNSNSERKQFWFVYSDRLQVLLPFRQRKKESIACPLEIHLLDEFQSYSNTFFSDSNRCACSGHVLHKMKLKIKKTDDVLSPQAIFGLLWKQSIMKTLLVLCVLGIAVLESFVHGKIYFWKSIILSIMNTISVSWKDSLNLLCLLFLKIANSCTVSIVVFPLPSLCTPNSKLFILLILLLFLGCTDKRRYCTVMAKMGYCNKKSVSKHLRRNCKKSCSLCGGGSGGAGQCGFKPGARIVGGTEAPERAWPWQAQILWSTSGNQFCGGTLVHPQWVVTAAHCVYKETASNIRVRWADE